MLKQRQLEQSVLGIGWSVTGTPTPPSAIIILIKVRWDQTNTQHILRSHLVDGDGNDVVMPQGPTGEDVPLEIQADFEVGRPAGLPRGTDIDHVIPLSIAPGMPLIPGQIYQWRLEIDSDEKAVRSFLVRRFS